MEENRMRATAARNGGLEQCAGGHPFVQKPSRKTRYCNTCEVERQRRKRAEVKQQNRETMR
jgi:hypothetical protein